MEQLENEVKQVIIEVLQLKILQPQTLIRMRHCLVKDLD